MTRSQVYKLIEKHYRESRERLVDLYSRRVGNFHVAEEIVQEGYTLACQYWNTYTKDENFDGWINTILGNAAKKAVREERKHGMVDHDTDPDSTLSSDASPEKKVYVNELINMITEEPRHTILKDFFIEQKSQEEISSEQGISQQAVSKIVISFREKITNEGGDVRHRDKRIAPCRGHGVVCSS